MRFCSAIIPDYLCVHIVGDRCVCFVLLTSVFSGTLWLFLIVSLTISGMSYYPEMEDTPLRGFLFGLNWVNPLLDCTFKIEKTLL